MAQSTTSVKPPAVMAVSMPTDDNESAYTEDAQPVRNANSRPACFQSTVQEILFIAAATMAIGMSSMLAGSITVTSSFVGESLNMSTAEITWLYSSSSLSSGAFLLFFGMVADLFGRKLMFVTSMLLFSLFCLAAGFAQSAISIDVLNGVLGLSAASAVPPAVGLLGAIYHQPGPRKNAAFASFAAGNPIGYAFGTIAGGVTTSLFGWRASFWWTAILILIFTVVSYFSVPRETSIKQPLTWTTLKRFDVVGTILTVCGIGMFTAALSLGQTAPQGWSTGYVLALLVVGLVMIIAFVFWEMRFENPLMPMHIWKDRNFTLVMSILMLGCMSFTPSAFFLALYFQSVWQRSAILVAVYLLPMAINGLLVNVFAGFFLHKISNKILMLAGASAYAIANLLFALNTYDSSYWAFCFPGLVILVVGADLEFNVANMFVMSSMPTSQQSLAGGIFQTVTKLCVAVGFGIATVVYDAVEMHPSLSTYWDEPTRPFAAVFWTSFTFSVLGILLVPFLTIGTQGGQARKPESEDTEVAINEKGASVGAANSQVI